MHYAPSGIRPPRREPEGHSQVALQFRFIPKRNPLGNYSKRISSALAEKPLEPDPCMELNLLFRLCDFGDAAEIGRAHEKVWRSHVGVGASSALQFQCKLKNARGLRLGDLPERRRVHVEYGRDQVGVVGYVEGLGPELDLRLLTEGEGLVE